MYQKAIMVAFVAVVGTGVALFKPLTNKLPSLTSSPTTVEQVQVKSATVEGNVTNERLNSEHTNLTKTKNLLRIKLNKARVVYLNSEVSYESSQDVANQIKRLNEESSEDIYLLIDSPGGSVLDGATVIAEIEASKAHVNTVCTRLCASMAAMIHSYGYKRYSTDRAILMYHPASGGGQGQIPNQLSELTTIQRYMDKMVANVTSRSKVDKAMYEKLIAYELWVDSEDSLERGLIDGIVNLNVPSGQPTASVTIQPDGHLKAVKTFFEAISPVPELWHRNAR